MNDEAITRSSLFRILPNFLHLHLWYRRRLHNGFVCFNSDYSITAITARAQSVVVLLRLHSIDWICYLFRRHNSQYTTARNHYNTRMDLMRPTVSLDIIISSIFE
jgi:hypothetical protein